MNERRTIAVVTSPSLPMYRRAAEAQSHSTQLRRTARPVPLSSPPSHPIRKAHPAAAQHREIPRIQVLCLAARKQVSTVGRGVVVFDSGSVSPKRALDDICAVSGPLVDLSGFPTVLLFISWLFCCVWRGGF